MKRGSVVLVAMQGDFGKPRPALVIQADYFANHPSVSLLLITGTLRDAPLLRILVEPTEQNGLHERSQIMVDKIMTAKREKIGQVVGLMEDETMVAVNRALLVFFGLA